MAHSFTVFCTYDSCKHWAHWYFMSPRARELMLKANPGADSYINDWGHRVNHPAYIPAGFVHWEALAEIEKRQAGVQV